MLYYSLVGTGSRARHYTYHHYHHLVFQKVGLPLIEEDCISVNAARFQTLRSIGYINIPVNFENQFPILKAFVIPNITLYLILGIDFWQTFQLSPKYISSI